MRGERWYRRGVPSDAATHTLVIGAGPAGLAAARALSQRGIPYDQVERHHSVGGIWDIDNPGSPMYTSAHFISSRTMSDFPGFPMPEDYPDYPSQRQILTYLRDFSDAYGLTERITFDRSVTRLEATDGGWRVNFDDGSRREYRFVIAATGTQWHPRLPQWPGTFDGEIRHSRDFTDADDLVGKRVLIVGAGNSGCDIACDVGRRAERTFLSVRRGYWFIPKHIFGIPSDVFADSGPHLPLPVEQRVFGAMLRTLNGDVTRLGLPQPDHRLFESHPILNTEILARLQHGDVIAKPDIDRFDGDSVVFTDGTRETIDVIIAATGYRHAIPYAQEYFGTEDHPDDLYLSVFSRRHRGLMAMGFIETNSGAYRLFDQSAQIVAGYIDDALHHPARAERFEQLIDRHHPDLTGGIRFIDSPRHLGYVDSAALRRIYDRVLRQMEWSAA